MAKLATRLTTRAQKTIANVSDDPEKTTHTH